MNARILIAVTIIVVIGGLVLYETETTADTKTFFAVTLAVVVGGLVLGGRAIQQESQAYVVRDFEQLSVGDIAPDFPVTTADGKETSFGRLREPVTIVAFVSPTGDECCWLNPELVSLAGKLRHRNVTVAQISEPTEKCPHGSGCVATCNLQDPHLISLCDADRIAWNAYRKPRPNTVVLIDRGGEVVGLTNLTDLQTVSVKASRLADELEAFEEISYKDHWPHTTPSCTSHATGRA